MSEATAVFTEARRLLDAGLSIVPIKPDGSKAPALAEWKTYQERLPTEAELGEWFGNGARRGIGVVGGAVSGNLECLDFDEVGIYEQWRELLETDYADLLNRLVVTRTPSGGTHVRYRCGGPIDGNRKLARRPPTPAEIAQDRQDPSRNGKPRLWEVMIETRGEGGQALVPPSPPECHELRKPYVTISGDMATLPTLTAEERAALLMVARSLNIYVDPESPARTPRERRERSAGDLLPGEDFDERGDPRPYLLKAGWTMTHTAGETEYWLRPGGDPKKKNSATLGHVAPDALYVFSTNASPFEAEKAYSPWRTYALLEHDGDFPAAAKSLYAQGYGTRREKSSGRIFTDADIPPEADESPGVCAWEEESVSRAPDSTPDEGEHNRCYRNSAPVEEGDPRPVDLLEGNVDGDGKDDHLTRRFADAILAADHYAQDQGGKLYLWSEGAYRQGGEKRIQAQVKLLALAWEEKWTSYRANEVVRYIAVDCPALWERPPTDRICVLNGILHLPALQLAAHTPEFLSTVQIAAAYDPAAVCPANERFAAEVFPEDAREVPWELFADALTPDHSSDDRAVLLHGEGSNGKSVWLETYMRFLGQENVSNVSLQKLSDNRFATNRLMGKLANVCPDLPSTHLSDSSVFKTITSGDPIDAEYKGRDGFTFRPFARLLFSSNPLPQSADASAAFFRRWIVIPFARKFEGKGEANRAQLVASLTSPEELSGVLNRALSVLARVREQKFTESQSMREAWEEMRATTDPMAVWLDRFTVEDYGEEAFVPKRDLHQRYARSCEAARRPPVSPTAFSLALKRLRPKVSDGRKSIREQRVEVWIGLTWREAEEGDPGPEWQPRGRGGDVPGYLLQ